MARYIARRLLQLIFVLVGISIVVFVTMHVLPGDVATLLLGDKASAQQLEDLRRQLGLDQPIYVQYLRLLPMRCRAISASRCATTAPPSRRCGSPFR